MSTKQFHFHFLSSAGFIPNCVWGVCVEFHQAERHAYCIFSRYLLCCKSDRDKYSTKWKRNEATKRRETEITAIIVWISLLSLLRCCCSRPKSIFDGVNYVCASLSLCSAHRHTTITFILFFRRNEIFDFFFVAQNNRFR